MFDFSWVRSRWSGENVAFYMMEFSYWSLYHYPFCCELYASPGLSALKRQSYHVYFSPIAIAGLIVAVLRSSPAHFVA